MLLQAVTFAVDGQVLFFLCRPHSFRARSDRPPASLIDVDALPPPQLSIDRRGVDRNASREAIDERQQRLAMRFAGGPVA